MNRLFILFFLLNVVFTQTIDSAIKGPIPGFTYRPDVGKFNINANITFSSSESSYDDNGDEIPYSDQFNFTLGDATTSNSISGIGYPKLIKNLLVCLIVII